MASGLNANFGTMAKPFHVGHCARNGLLAALMAEQGFEANHGVMEHRQGFLDVFNGPGLHDAARLFEGWAAPLEIEAPGIALKQFPCCGSTHPAIAMMLRLAKEERITAAEVARIEILPHGRRLTHTNTPWPTTPLAAKFSVQYAVVRALLSGVPRIAHFEGEAALEPEVQRLLAVTTAAPHPDMPADGEKQWGAEVIVTTTDGRRLSRRVDQLVGRGGDDPMSSAELFEKFEDCAARGGLPREAILPLFDRLERLESVADVRDVIRLLERPAHPGGARERAPPALVKV
jgi:2-methylcitrate dehydratase PrpD